MRLTLVRSSTFALGALLFALALPASLPASAAERAASQTAAANPFESEIVAFEQADKMRMPAPGGVVFVGSSSFKTWNLEENFPNRGYINRGFGGSTMADAAYYVDRIAIKYKPRTIVLYEGDNDVNAGVSGEAIVAQLDKFVRAVHAQLPQTRIVVLSIKPSIARWALVDRMRAANEMIKAYVERNDNMAYVDADYVFMGWNHQPRPELYDPKGKLHPSAEGKKIWAWLLEPYLKDGSGPEMAAK
jgi:lysophospholipase L1-like esterase